MVRRTKARKKKSQKSKKGDDILLQSKHTDADLTTSIGATEREAEQEDINIKSSGTKKKCSSPESKIIKEQSADVTNPFVCEQCPSILKNSKSYREHMRRVHREKTHKCKECGKFFLYECILKEHSLIHTGETPHQCPHCPKKFRTKSNLTRHLIIHGISNETRALYKCQCDICGKMVRFASNLLAHKRSHENERPFMCVECGKQFKTKAHVDLHMACHLDFKPHECETCGKSFHDKSNYRKHLLIHQGDKRFKCDTCDWAFVRKDQLKMHQRTHTKVSFQCSVCDKKFKTEAYYKTHLSQHAMGNNFLCSVCDKVYSSNSNLKMHMRKCHGSSMSVTTEDGKRKLLSEKNEGKVQSKRKQVVTVFVLKGKEKELFISNDGNEGSDEPGIENVKAESYSELHDTIQEDDRQENENILSEDEMIPETLATPKEDIEGHAETNGSSKKSEIVVNKSAILEDKNTTKLQEMTGVYETIRGTSSLEKEENNMEPEGETDGAKIALETTLETNVLEAGTKELIENDGLETSSHDTTKEGDAGTNIKTAVRCIQIYIDGQLCTLTGLQSDSVQNS